MDEYEEIIAKLYQKTGEKVKFASEQVEELLELPSLRLNRALEGGIPYGHQTLIWGGKSGSKSALAYGAIANAQKQGKVCMLLDSEKAMKKEWLEALGVDTSKLVWKRVISVDDITRQAIAAMESGIQVVAIDSITVMAPHAYYEKDGKTLKEGLDGTKQIGTLAVDVSNMLRKFNAVNEQTALILIAQPRFKITTYGGINEPTGGQAVGFYSTVSLKIMPDMATDHQKKGKVRHGDLILEEVVGRPINWTIDKDRGPGMFMTGTYDFYFKGDHVGVDAEKEMVDVGVELGLVEKSGSWYTLYGERRQGSSQMADYLREFPEVKEKLWGELLDA